MTEILSALLGAGSSDQLTIRALPGCMLFKTAGENRLLHETQPTAFIPVSELRAFRSINLGNASSLGIVALTAGEERTVASIMSSLTGHKVTSPPACWHN